MAPVASEDHRVDVLIPGDIETVEPVRGFSDGDVDAVVIPGIVRGPESRHGVAIAPNSDPAGLLNRDTHSIGPRERSIVSELSSSRTEANA